MKIKLILLLLVLSAAGNVVSEAQIRSILREKAREALQQGEKEEERTQEDKPRQPSALEKSLEQRMMNAMGFANVEFENQYNFNSSMSMDVENYDAQSDKASVITYTTYFNKSDESFAMRFSFKNEDTGEDESTLMIFDMKNHVMLMLAESGNEKSGMAFSIAPDGTDSGSPDQLSTESSDDGHEEIIPDADFDSFNLWYKKTGRTKSISGYTCEEYIWEDEQGRIEYWFSPEAQFDYSSAYNYISGFQALAMGGTTFSGMLMEMHHIDKETNNRTKLLVNDIKADNPSTIDIKDFQIMSFGGK
jgi:hypothetical protein